MNETHSSREEAVVRSSDVYVTTVEAARLTGYTPDHIGLLLRKKVLMGEKRGRDWFVKLESIKTYLASSPKAGRPKS